MLRIQQNWELCIPDNSVESENFVLQNISKAKNNDDIENEPSETKQS